MLKVGFLGSGRMAQALAKGFISAGLTSGNNIAASGAPGDYACIEAFQKFGAFASFENASVIEKSDIILVAVKPSVIPKAFLEIKPLVSKRHLFLSVAMGFTLADLEKNLPIGTRVMRVMSNTPAYVGSAASVLVRGSAVSNEDVEVTKKLFESVGSCDEVQEHTLDAITAMSGSGPAYIYVVIEAMADGGVKMGLPRDLAYKLAAQTVMGASKMVLETNFHPAKLKDDVTSPGGTTAVGLHELEKHGIRTAFISAIEAAAERSQKQVN